MTCASFLAQAQFTSRLGRFQVDQVKGCVPLTIKVTILSPWKCDGTNPCDAQYEGVPPSKSLINPPDFVYTYTTAGTFTLEVVSKPRCVKLAP